MNNPVRWLPQYSCHVCGGAINSWDYRISPAVGHTKITCEKCIAKEYGYTVEELRDDLEESFGMKPCAGI